MTAFNHAMVYSRNIEAAVSFYAGLLGFEVLETVEGPGRCAYARLKPSEGDSTIALHLLPPGGELHTGGVRLYFEVKNLDRFCKRLEKAGGKFSQPPKLMPWGWKHAYLDDPDGHEVSLYWAGAKRLKKTRLPKAKAAARGK
jgi:catechol 2,3-dioxygenase-like lactoylglutathione lyase family enzyme